MVGEEEKIQEIKLFPGWKSRKRECYSLLQFVTICRAVTFVNWLVERDEWDNVTMLQCYRCGSEAPAILLD